MKKIISLILVIALVIVACPAVFAAEENTEEYVVTYSCEAITDIEGLTELALSQKGNKKATRTAALNAEANSEDNLLTATQLLEVREYTDGAVEKDYAVSNIALGSEAYDDFPNSDSGYDNHVLGYDISATLNYTVRTENEYPPFVIKIRIDKVSTTIVKRPTQAKTTIANVMLSYKYPSASPVERYYTYDNNSTSTTKVYTLYSTGGFCLSTADEGTALFDGPSAQAYINFDDGDVADVALIAMP